jgi:hypothetical protein
MPDSDLATLHAEWLQARAAVAQYSTPRSADIDTMTATLEAERAAEWKLLQTSARDFNDIRTRAQIVLEMFARAETDGVPTDNRHRLMLAALVSEICRYSPDADDSLDDQT